MTTHRPSHNLQKLLLGVFLTAAVGCAGNLQDARPARGVGEWTFHLPDTKSPIHELAYGRGGSSTPAPEQALLASNDTPKPKQRAMQQRRPAKVITPAPVLDNTTALPQQEEAPSAAPATQEPVQLAMATTDTSADQRYGEREAESRNLQTFKGGDAVVIGISAGALVVVLLIVLLILLLR